MKTYGIDDAKAIIRDYGERWFEFTENGVILRPEALQFDPSQQLHWKYLCELDGPDAPNPLTAPCLPFPFNANQLAAFMLDGVGAVLPSIYGDWETGPDQGMLDTISVLGREPKAALKAAYNAFRTTQHSVGDYPLPLQKQADRLARIFNYMNLRANTREGVFAKGITSAEGRTRRERAKRTITEIAVRCDQAKEAYQAAFRPWRKSMVQQLLLPQNHRSGPMTIADIAYEVPSWRVKTTVKATPGYRGPLAKFLKFAQTTGGSRPTAQDVIEAWAIAPPIDITVIKDWAYIPYTGRTPPSDKAAIKNGIHFRLETGAGKQADFKSISASIKNLTESTKSSN